MLMTKIIALRSDTKRNRRSFVVWGPGGLHAPRDPHRRAPQGDEASLDGRLSAAVALLLLVGLWRVGRPLVGRGLGRLRGGGAVGGRGVAAGLGVERLALLGGVEGLLLLLRQLVAVLG